MTVEYWQYGQETALTGLNEELVKAVDEGRSWKPQEKDLLNGCDISADTIRSLLLGNIYRTDTTGKYQKRTLVDASPYGIRIDCQMDHDNGDAPMWHEQLRLKISGSLDIPDLSGPDGVPLPPVEFRWCEFENAIDISGASISRLSLRGSRFSALDAAGVQISGRLDLRHCGPLPGEPIKGKDQFEYFPFYGKTFERASEDDESLGGFRIAKDIDKTAFLPENSDLACCVLNLGSATIAGTLDLSYANFCRARDQVNIFGTGKSNLFWAINLGHAQIRDSVEIIQTVIIGSINLTNCEIDDDLLFMGSRIFAYGKDSYSERGSNAVDMRLATIGGLFSAIRTSKDKLTARPDFEYCIFVGSIEGIGLRAREVWIGGGVYAEHSKFYDDARNVQSGKRVIELPKARIDQSLTIGAYSEKGQHETAIYGLVYLNGIDIGKNLEINMVGIPNPGTSFENKEEDSSNPLSVMRLLGLDHAEDFYRKRLERSDLLPIYFRVKAHSANIGRRAYFSSTHFTNSGPYGAKSKFHRRAAIDFWKSTISTGFRIGEKCEVFGGLLLNRCQIGREVSIQCRQIRVEKLTDSNIVPVALTLSGSVIDGDVKIGPKEDWELSHPLAHPPSDTDDRTVIRSCMMLSGSVINGSLTFANVQFDLGEFGENGADDSSDWGRTVLGLRDATITGALMVALLPWLPKAAQGQAETRSGLWQKIGWEERISEESNDRAAFVVDLSGLSCGFLEDRFGEQWQFDSCAKTIQLRLARLSCGRVEPSSRAKRDGGAANQSDGAGLQRMNWLGRQFVPPLTHMRANDPAKKRWFLTCWGRWRSVKDDSFVAQTYDEFATRHIQAGERQIGYNLLIEKKDNQNAIMLRRLMRQPWQRWWITLLVTILIFILACFSVFLWFPYQFGVDAGAEWRSYHIWLLLMPPLAYLTLRLLFFGIYGFGALLFRTSFHYGLNPLRGLLTFVLLLAFGAGGVHYARTGSLVPKANWDHIEAGATLDSRIALVLDVAYEPEPGASPVVEAHRVRGRAVVANATPCNLGVNSILYAADVFVPLVDLDQRRRCRVRDAENPGSDRYYKWRWFKAIYEALGWIVTSLLILSVSGVTRRDLNR